MIPGFLLFGAIPGARVNTFALILDPRAMARKQPVAPSKSKPALKP